ncbi:hypothetical protein GQ457_12G007760 [Hibiscus cannabinus]
MEDNGGAWQSDRPPDGIPTITVPPACERHGSPVASEIQRVPKKSKNTEDGLEFSFDQESMDFESNEMEQVGGGVSAKTVEGINGASEHQRAKASYASMVSRKARTDKNVEDGGLLREDEVVVLDEDCLVDHAGSYPTICFSDRVHEQIDRCMRNVIVIHLLGRAIGYKTLLSRIHAIWKPLGDLQLIDLENNYFLVRFADSRDYSMVFTEGPWTIFGSYLTVQPWSRSFSTTEKHLSHVIVWVHLPRLPYKYYTKALFRRIAAVMGRVVKVDYNTQAGERGKFARLAIMVDLNKPILPCVGIDCFVQKLEYEGLQNICYSCGVYGHSQDTCPKPPSNLVARGESSGSKVGAEVNNKGSSKEKSLYGPWMIVENRRSITVVNTKLGNGMEHSGNKGSRYAMLQVDDDSIDPPNANTIDNSNVASVLDPVVGGEVGVHLGSSTSKDQGSVVKNDAYLASNPGKNLQLLETNVITHTGNISGDHSVVVILEKGHGNLNANGNTTSKVRAASAKGSKDSANRGLKVRKNLDVRGGNRVALREWAENASAHLFVIKEQSILSTGGDTPCETGRQTTIEPLPPDNLHSTVASNSKPILIIQDDQHGLVMDM